MQKKINFDVTNHSGTPCTDEENHWPSACYGWSENKYTNVALSIYLFKAKNTKYNIVCTYRKGWLQESSSQVE